jgi:energy-coupling factor transporter ATP-binding protein EcfA2
LSKNLPASELVEEVADSFRKGRAKANAGVSTVSRTGPQDTNLSDAASMRNVALRALGFVRDPFNVDYVLSRPSLFTMQTRLTLSRLAERAGFAAESKTNMLLVGPEGSGKTLLLRSLAKSLTHTTGKDSALYVDARTEKHRYGGNQLNDASQSQVIEAALGINPTKKGLMIIDNADWMLGRVQKNPALLDGGQREAPVLILGVSYPIYSIIRSNQKVSQKFKVHLWAPLQEKWETERMLRELVRSSAPNGEPFEPSAYKELSALAMGLPGLATDLAGGCVLVANGVGAPQVTKVIVDKVAEYLMYDQANQLLSGQIRLQGTKGEIASEAMRKYYTEGEVRRSDFLEAFESLSRSTLAYHLKDLVNEKILVLERFGFRVRYDIPKPVRAALQIIEGRSVTGA